MRRAMMSIVAFIAASAATASDNTPAPADHLPQQLLTACDKNALAFGAYETKIAAAINTLLDLNVFSADDIHDVKIGFCGLRDAGGPVATTSCAGNTILLDKKYRRNDQRLTLTATLAHELKHHLQHKELKSRFGDSYCSTKRYGEDTIWMETEADAFGDQVAALLFTGRRVEIHNGCPVDVSVYLESEHPVSSAHGADAFFAIAAQSSAIAPVDSATRFFKFYGRSETHEGRRWLWRDTSTDADWRTIGGKTYGLKRTAFSSPSRSTGAFQLKLTCP